MQARRVPALKTVTPLLCPCSSEVELRAPGRLDYQVFLLAALFAPLIASRRLTRGAGDCHEWCPSDASAKGSDGAILALRCPGTSTVVEFIHAQVYAASSNASTRSPCL